MGVHRVRNLNEIISVSGVMLFGYRKKCVGSVAYSSRQSGGVSEVGFLQVILGILLCISLLSLHICRVRFTKLFAVKRCEIKVLPVQCWRCSHCSNLNRKPRSFRCYLPWKLEISRFAIGRIASDLVRFSIFLIRLAMVFSLPLRIGNLSKDTNEVGRSGRK